MRTLTERDFPALFALMRAARAPAPGAVACRSIWMDAAGWRILDLGEGAWMAQSPHWSGMVARPAVDDLALALVDTGLCGSRTLDLLDRLAEAGLMSPEALAESERLRDLIAGAGAETDRLQALRDLEAKASELGFHLVPMMVDDGDIERFARGIAERVRFAVESRSFPALDVTHVMALLERVREEVAKGMLERVREEVAKGEGLDVAPAESESEPSPRNLAFA